MRFHICGFASVFCLVAAHAAQTTEIKSGLQPGELTSCLHVHWAIGGPNPGNAWTRPGIGCITCWISEFKNPPNSVTLVFIRKVDARVLNLVKALDTVVPKYGGVVCGLGDVDQKDLQKLEPHATKMPLTVSEMDAKLEQKWKLNAEAEVTIIVYDTSSRTTANFAFRKTDELTTDKIGEIVTVAGNKPTK